MLNPADKGVDRQNANIIGKRQKIMTMRETIEIIRESPLWGALSKSEKIDALDYALASAVGLPVDSSDQTDITDFIGEIFIDNN